MSLKGHRNQGEEAVREVHQKARAVRGRGIEVLEADDGIDWDFAISLIPSAYNLG